MVKAEQNEGANMLDLNERIYHQRIPQEEEIVLEKRNWFQTIGPMTKDCPMCKKLFQKLEEFQSYMSKYKQTQKETQEEKGLKKRKNRSSNNNLG